MARDAQIDEFIDILIRILVLSLMMCVTRLAHEDATILAMPN
jgi:hypothetical protein